MIRIAKPTAANKEVFMDFSIFFFTKKKWK